MKQGRFPVFCADFLDICDPVLAFDRIMEEINVGQYLKPEPYNRMGRPGYNRVNMLKTILFGFMDSEYVSLRELEDRCKVNIRYMYLMDYEKPSYRSFSYFINEELKDTIEDIFRAVMEHIRETENVDMEHIYIDGTKFEANANKFTWVWKKATEKSRYRLYRSDMDCFIPLMKQFNKLYGFYPKYPVADAGYGSYNDYLYCEEHGMEKYMKFPMYEKETKDESYRSDPFRAVNFGRDENGDPVCPNGKKFRFAYRKPVKGNRYGRQEEYYTCEDCSGCPYGSQCKKTEKNRTVRMNAELSAMHKEVIENLESIHGALLRMNRSIQSEGTFGIMKYDRCYDRIVRRGIDSVRLEIFQVSLGHNLYKYHNKKLRIRKTA